MLNTTHNGVLLPAEMRDATEADKDTYAEQVKRGNRAFIAAYWALEDALERVRERGLGY